MSIEIRMPMWGMGMLEGTIVEWYKHEGDAVEEGETLAEVEAAKTTEDLVAPASGTLTKILVAAGETVPVQELLAILGTPEEASTPIEPGQQAAAQPTAPPAATGPAAGTAAGPAAASQQGGDDRVRNVVPRARQLARERGIDLGTLTGTGPGGRITVADVEKAGPSRERGSLVPTDTVPLTGMRGTIARRMLQSIQTTAQLTLVTTADVTQLVENRDAWQGRPRPTYTDYVVKAVALALREHPRLNATIDGDTISLMGAVHIGIATDVPGGLVVPVVRDVDTLRLEDLARTSAGLVEKVRRGTFGVEDVSGGTFSVSSLGGQGIDVFTPIINPPQVAILGIGRIVEHPVREGDGLAWRKAITLSLTIDHRAVDGAPGAAFLQTVGTLLGDPDRLAQHP